MNPASAIPSKGGQTTPDQRLARLRSPARRRSHRRTRTKAATMWTPIMLSRAYAVGHTQPRCRDPDASARAKGGLATLRVATHLLFAKSASLDRVHKGFLAKVSNRCAGPPPTRSLATNRASRAGSAVLQRTRLRCSWLSGRGVWVGVRPGCCLCSQLRGVSGLGGRGGWLRGSPRAGSSARVGEHRGGPRRL